MHSTEQAKEHIDTALALIEGATSVEAIWRALDGPQRERLLDYAGLQPKPSEGGKSMVSLAGGSSVVHLSASAVWNVLRKAEMEGDDYARFAHPHGTAYIRPGAVKAIFPTL